MANALQTGVAGLNSHNQLLNVVGNNIANVNTVAYKGRQVVFADLFYQTQRAGSGATSSGVGGINASQIGSGSTISQISVNNTQGNFESTSDPLHAAIDGQGFFVMQSPGGPLYTRAGAFGIDGNGYLVDPASGYTVQRVGTVGEGGDDSGIAFQTVGNNNIIIPLGAVVPGQATTRTELIGNLPSSATGPMAQMLRNVSPLLASGVPATGATLLNALDINGIDYVGGDTLSITGTDANGAPVSATFAVDGTTTVANLVSAIDAAFANATATLDAQGRIQLQANATGPSYLSLTIADNTTNAGSSNFANAGMVVATVGKDADVVQGGIQVFDSRGTPHNLQVAFERQSDGSWNAAVTMPATSGTVVDGIITGIRFNDDGSFGSVTGTGVNGPTLSFQFAGQSSPQTILVDFGDAGTFKGLTSVSTEALLTGNKDGFGAGTLTSVRIGADGIIQGFASNGVSIPIAQLAVASFQNVGGLETAGQGYLRSSRNSGEAVIGSASAGGRGSIRAGELEQSNVDLAYEFTRLIVAQRGFSANARTITVADAILRELTNLIQ